MHSLIHGKLFYIGTVSFAVGILWGTLRTIPVAYSSLSIFSGFLCILFCWVETTFPSKVQGRHTSEKILEKTLLCALGLILIMIPVGEVRAVLAPHVLPPVFSALITSAVPVSLTGIIIADPDIRIKNQQILISVIYANEKTNVLAFAPLFQHFAYGEKVLLAGTLKEPAPFITPEGRTFRYDNFLSKKGVFAVLPQADILEMARPTGFLNYIGNLLFKIKHTFVEGLSKALPDPYAELATGLLTGDQHQLGDSIISILALSGLIWIVVLSGYHITIITQGILALSSCLPRKYTYVIAGSGVTSIIFATGASAPSIRGGLMACLTLYARATGRTYDAIRALCISIIIILLWNPFLLAYDSGFQLSIAVTPLLILGVPIIEARLLWIKQEIVREVIAVSAVAQVACVPLILWQTGQVELWAIPVNIFVMWLVPVGMFFSMLAGVCGVFIPQLAQLAGLPAYFILQYVLEMAKAAAKLPFANLLLPQFPFIFVVGMYGVLIWIGYSLKRRPVSRIVFTLPRSEISSQ